ncbi:MAG: exodeoxyribonuclease VII large subunit [Bacteroidales bacterium]|nr:exodeoxyribonuclease VII large subunit [Bacteroidales bacterium]
MPKMCQEYMTLSAYISQVKGLIEDAGGLPQWIVCELANVSWNRGHCYLELVETSAVGVVEAKARGTIWSYRAAALSQAFEDSCGAPLRKGIKVMLYVQSQMSELYGFSLNVLDLDPSYTLGDLEAKKQATLKRLAEEDLLERNKELEVPALPYRIAIVSAEGAAGYGDFLKHLKDSGVDFEIELFEAAMQGESAPESIAEAFSLIEERAGEFDTVAFIRGGGSNLDLACFDDYLIARSIALCSLPVISGIGHERDNHICDEVASVRVKTPTGAADFIIGRFADAFEALQDVSSRLFAGVEDALSGCGDVLERLSSRFSSSLRNYTEVRGEKLSNLRFRLEKAALGNIDERLHSLDRVLTLLQGADPSRILDRGYGIVTIGGQKVTDISSVAEGARLVIMMKDGKVSLTAKDVVIEKKTEQ